MKKMIIAALAALGIALSAAAQSTVVVNAAPQQGQSLTITGKLETIDWNIAIRAEGVVYYMPELKGLAGFVPALQEGAAVTVTGNAYAIASKPGYSHLAVTKLAIAGKDYDLSSYYKIEKDDKKPKEPKRK
jgi:hypothetical protein